MLILKLTFIAVLPFANGDYEEQFEKLFKLTTHDRSDAHVLLYKNETLPRLKKKSCAEMEKTELQVVNNLLETLVFYSFDKPLTKMYVLCFNHLNKIDKQNKKDVADVYHNLYRVRLFDEANEFYKKYSYLDMELLPQITNKTEILNSPVYVIEPTTKNTFKRKSFDYSNYDGIIVNATPLCGFCKYLISDVSEDKGMSIFMMLNSTWLSLPGRSKYFKNMEDWNNKHPYARLSIIEDISDFTNLDFDGTPTIFFLKNGIVKDKLVGWPKEGRMRQLKELIKKYYSIDIH